MSKLQPGRIAAFDLETTHLKGNMGHVLCGVIKIVGTKEAYKWRIDYQKGFDRSNAKAMVNDKQMVKEMRDVIDGCDALLMHYGMYFDLPFLNTRLLVHKLRPCANIAIIDTWKIARKQLALTGNSQEAVCDLVDATHKKYKPGWAVWRKAMYGDSAAISKLMKYNENDVDGLIDNYMALRPLIHHHPYMGTHAGQGHNECPACGSTKTHGHGTRRTKKQLITRRICTECGSTYDAEKKTMRASK